MPLTIRSLLPAVVLAVGAASAQAIWMRPDMQAPVERLIANAENRLKDAPESAEIHYQLGRLHSLAWAKEGQMVGVYSDEKTQGFTFPSWNTIRTKREERQPASVTEIEHLRDSLTYYSKAVALAPENALYAFGYAWMVEQVAPYSGVIALPEGLVVEGGAAGYKQKALDLYRRSYELSKPADLKSEGDFIGVPEHFISREAGNQVMRLVDQEKIGEYRDGEKADIEATIRDLSSRAKAITPIIFPSNGFSSFASLINRQARVKFDLSGHGDGTEWPWVTKQAAFLVWDPNNTGRVSSGRQMFGTSTFWMFFRNGYEALDTLDNDADGWLSGAELRGISVWQDKNENAVSDPGEVMPANWWRIEKIHTKFDQRLGDMPWAKTGMVMNGRSVSTYDWTPKSW